MSAQIRISVERGGVIISTNVNQSVDNVRKGDIVYCESVDIHTTYAWTLVFTPDSPNGTVSSSGLIAPPGTTANNCKFVVDNEGAYLIRLVVDAGLGTESTQFLRIRKVTRFGDLKLVAAGERKDSVGAIPHDIDPVGWSDNQNQNLQKLLAYVRRLSTSGRVLYVDANRGRKAFDSTQNANDHTNMLEMPGSDLAALTTSGVMTDAEGFADFSNISSAISYANSCSSRGETPLSADHPYIILIQNGLYIEDVNLVENIHLVSADNFFTNSDTYSKGVVIQSTNATGGHTFVGTNNSDTVMCVGVEFENIDPASTNPTFKVQKGIAYFMGCTISHKNGTGGTALSVMPLNPTSTDECQAHLINSYVQNTVANATDYAIKCGGECAYLVIRNSTVVGQNAIQCNADFGGGLKEEAHLHIKRSNIMANNVAGYAVLSNASDLKIEHSYIVGSDATKVLVIGENLPKVGDVIVKLSFSEFYNAQITFDTRQIAGSKNLQTSSCIYSGYVFPDAPPSFTAHTQAKSLKYEKNYLNPFDGGSLAVPAPQQLSADDVQDALDELTLLSTMLGAFGIMNSLDVAYDGIIAGPTAGSGDGRKIAADAGAVVIQSASTPYTTTPISGTETTPLTSADKNGYLQIEGNLEVGKVDSAEMDFISNYGTIGSMLSMGSVTWNSEIASVASGVDHRSLPSAIVQGNSDKNSLLHNYNLRLQTKSTNNISNGSVGWVILQGGDSLEKGADAPHAGDVYIQGGSYLESTFESIGADCPAGSVHLIPGTSTAIGSDKAYGYVRIVDPSASTSASLLGAGPNSDPTTCAGEISWATPMGVVTATITIGMTTADVCNAINNATVGAGLIFAQPTSGRISVTCVSKGELSDIVYVGDTDSGNLNADLGDFTISGGAVFTAGTDPQYVNLHSSAMHELTIGEGGATGPMIYNSATGKLTVPGLIDPIGMIFSQTAGGVDVPTTATEGAIFVSDGSNSLIADKLYYKPANNGTPVLISGGGGGAGLTNWSEDGVHLVPNATSQNIGSVTNWVETIFVKDGAGKGITFVNGDGSTLIGLTVNSSGGSPVLEFNGTSLLTTASVASKIELSDLSVTTNAASGSGALSYDDSTGVFTFTPADVSGGGSGFTNWSEDGTQNLVTNSVDNIGSNTQHIGSIRQRSGKSITTYSSGNDKQWEVSYLDLTSSGGTGNPIVANYYATNDVANVVLNDGIQFNFQYNADVDGIILQPGSMRLVFSDLTDLASNYSTAFEFWVADAVTSTKYFSIDGSANSVVFHKVPTLYTDTTVNLNAYSDLADGMIAFDTTSNNVVYYSSGGWAPLGGGGGGLGGSGNSQELAIFDGAGNVQGNGQLLFDSAAHKLRIDTTNALQGAWTHYTSSGDANEDSWLVGRNQYGDLAFLTEGVEGASYVEGSYNRGWIIEHYDETGTPDGAHLLPTHTNSQNIGSATKVIGDLWINNLHQNSNLRFHINGKEAYNMTSISFFGIDDGTNTDTNINQYDLGNSTNWWKRCYADTYYGNAYTSFHFVHKEGETEYDWALSVQQGDLVNPKLMFNGKVIGGNNALVENHSIATKYGSAAEPMVYKVTVGAKTAEHIYEGVAGSSSDGYFLNGIESPAIRFSGVDSATANSGYVYRFDQSDASNAGHPLRFYLTANKVDPTTAADNEYTTGVTTNGTPGTAGAYTQIEVTDGTPNILYYQCSAHQLMGNHATTISNAFNDNGTVIDVGSLGGGGATDKIEEGNTSVEVQDSGSNGVIILSTEGDERWRVRTAGHFVPQGTTGTLNIGQSDARIDGVFGNEFNFLNGLGTYTTLSAGGVGGLAGMMTFTIDGGSPKVIATQSDTLSTFGSTAFFDAHLIPTANATYDIGTAENKVRHLFLSDNSLKFVNDSNTEFALGVDGTGKLVFEGDQLLPNAIKNGDDGIEVQSAGGGIAFTTGGGLKWAIQGFGNLVPNADSYNIGIAGGNEINNLFVRNVVTSAETIASRTLANSTNAIRLESTAPVDVTVATQDLLVHNVVKETWRGSNADDRADEVMPMFVYHPENLITFKPNELFLTTLEGYQPMGSTSGDIIYQDKLDYLTTNTPYADGQGIYSSGSHVPMRKVILKSDEDIPSATRGIAAGLMFQCSQYLSNGVRGFGYGSFSSLTSGQGFNGKTDILSFFITNTGIRTDASAVDGVSNLNGVRASVYATVWNGTSWSQQTIVNDQECVRHNNNVADEDSTNGQVVSLRVDQPARLFDPEHRYGQVVVHIKVYFDAPTAGDGDPGSRNYFAISDVRLHAFGNS